jgi:hypothetical protein
LRPKRRDATIRNTLVVGIQNATEESVVAIKDIRSTIDRIAEISSAIAAAVEQQGTATNEITGNIQQAAKGATQVTASIVEVNQGAGETGSVSSQVLASATQVAAIVTKLACGTGRTASTSTVDLPKAGIIPFAPIHTLAATTRIDAVPHVSAARAHPRGLKISHLSANRVFQHNPPDSGRGDMYWGSPQARRRHAHISLGWITVATVRWHFTASLIPSAIDGFFDYMHEPAGTD